ncbi:MAG: hypothetical protein HZA91_11670 [Verrucomicrobia bacterium]|nr:hypothetical protein [Verrucomicrobiota bacterium]
MNTRRHRVLSVLLLAPMAAVVATNDDLRPGLAYVQFHSPALSRPAANGIDPQVNLDTGSSIRDFSRVWLGSLKAPVAGELAVTADADNGCRLFVGGKRVIDAWSRPAGEGKLTVNKGELLPIRLEFFQNGGTAHARLCWSWPGHSRELIPPTAFFHSPADEQTIKNIMGKPVASPVPADPLANCASIYGTPESASASRRPAGPLVLRPGTHLFIDNHLIESGENVARKVVQPQRDPSIPNPVVTGPEDRCFQPYLTVLRDPQTGRFRIWYGAWRDDKSMGASHLAHMESDDGIHWKRPPQILKDPAPIQFGSEVLDEGADYPDPARRYKYGWFHGGGLRVAGSPDGLNFTPLAPGVVLPQDHDINNVWRDPIRKRYVATVSSVRGLPQFKGRRRTTLQAASDDLLRWSTPWVVLAPDDRYDKDITQFYAMSGFLARGELVIGLVKILHDDWKAEGAPEGAFGVGYTTLAWTRDGEHWVRDLEPFFYPDPKPGAWDHAHAWMDEQLPMGDEVYLYYGGYKWGHKHNRFEERQIGLVKMRRDRYVAREAGAQSGSLRTPPLVLRASALTVNADVTGELKLRVLDESGQPLPGFDWASARGDRLDHAVVFQRPLSSLAGKPVRLEFRLQRARLFGFDLLP